MPNPFKHPGDAFHQPGDWIAPHIGLIGKLEAQLAHGHIRNIALIGDVGSGKTAALTHYRSHFEERGIILPYSLEDFNPQGALDLHLAVYHDLIDRIGVRAHDEAAEKLGLLTKGSGSDLRLDQVMVLIEQIVMLSSSKKDSPMPIHLLIDECQHPAEAFEEQEDNRNIVEWFRLLQSLSKRIRSGGGCAVITITPSPWESHAPRQLRDRVAQIVADPPTSDQIDVFIKHGLKHAGSDKPTTAEIDLGPKLFDFLKEKGPITIRVLHEKLHIAWERAHQQEAETLSSAHLL
jgi:hypothetical protein